MFPTRTGDRQRAAEDRKQAAEDHKQARGDREQIRAALSDADEFKGSVDATS